MYTDAVYIPRLLDARERFVFLSAYEVVAIFAALMLGQLSGKWVLALFCGIIFFIATRKFDQKGYFDTVGYICYWYMPEALLKPLQMNYFTAAPSYNRELVG
ncbi:MAG: type IV conjugative transfer system protein TraL [Maricaulaceae bacterium]